MSKHSINFHSMVCLLHTYLNYYYTFAEWSLEKIPLLDMTVMVDHLIEEKFSFPRKGKASGGLLQAFFLGGLSKAFLFKRG